MGATMAWPRKATRPQLPLPRLLVAALALLALASAVPWAGLSAAGAAKPSGTTSFPVPATARPQSPSAGVTTGSATATAPGATTPTTTYAPSGAATAPATPAGAAPTTTPTTTTTNVSSTPAAGVPATSTAQGSASKAKASKGDRPLSTGAIVIAVLAALLVLACAAWALARSSAFEPHWLLLLRHAMAEAGFRASATWSEFADWARLGR